MSDLANSMIAKLPTGNSKYARPNSRLNGNKPRPAAWWLGVSKDKTKAKKADDPYRKLREMNPKVVYNLTRKGFSVGMSFDLQEVKKWTKDCAKEGTVIQTVRYTVPQGI